MRESVSYVHVQNSTLCVSNHVFMCRLLTPNTTPTRSRSHHHRTNADLEASLKISMQDSNWINLHRNLWIERAKQLARGPTDDDMFDPSGLRHLSLVIGSYAVLLLSLYGGVKLAGWKDVSEGGWTVQETEEWRRRLRDVVPFAAYARASPPVTAPSSPRGDHRRTRSANLHSHTAALEVEPRSGYGDNSRVAILDESADDVGAVVPSQYLGDIPEHPVYNSSRRATSGGVAASSSLSDRPEYEALVEYYRHGIRSGRVHSFPDWEAERNRPDTERDALVNAAVDAMTQHAAMTQQQHHARFYSQRAQPESSIRQAVVQRTASVAAEPSEELRRATAEMAALAAEEAATAAQGSNGTLLVSAVEGANLVVAAAQAVYERAGIPYPSAFPQQIQPGDVDEQYEEDEYDDYDSYPEESSLAVGYGDAARHLLEQDGEDEEDEDARNTWARVRVSHSPPGDASPAPTILPTSPTESTSPPPGAYRGLLREAQAALEEAQNELLCQICFTNRRDALLMPCLHLLYCSQCVDRVAREAEARGQSDRCPCCRQSVCGVLRCRHIV